MPPWDLLIDRNDLQRTEVRNAGRTALDAGEARLAVERLALTANNVTYGLMGESFGYWKFFPAPEGFGRIPAWGFARVIESTAPDAPVGLRLFGYLPMSSEVVMRLSRTRTGFLDAAAHRSGLPPTYNAYTEAPDDALDDHRALLRPLLMTSFLLDDLLAQDAALTTLVLSSASSKTGMGLAWFARRRGLEVIGLSSPANAERLRALGLYDAVLPYDRASDLRPSGPAAYIDFAGDAAIALAAHTALGAALTRSLIVGVTHWQAAGPAQTPPPGPTPTLFFAPDQVRKRMADWGPGELDARFDAALRAFVADAGWLNLVQHQGPQGLADVYRSIIGGRVRPEDGHIIRPA